MDFNCKQVLENLNPHHLSLGLPQQERDKFKPHLLGCSNCRTEYEEMLHAIAVLESLPEPVPPPDLVKRIQGRIAQERSHNRLAFIANPIASLLNALRLGPHPTFVNYTAVIFYLMLTIFLVKVTFFGPTDEPRVTPSVKLTEERVRSVAAPWGSVKYSVLQSDRIEGEKPSKIPIKME